MSLLVQYSIEDGKAGEQTQALTEFVADLKQLGDGSFNYTAFETDDPTSFIALLEFDEDAGKERFLASDAFAKYRDGTKGRFTAPPSTTPIKLVASTKA